MIEFFYYIKPFMPRRLQLFARRIRARYKRKGSRDNWPIDHEASIVPEGWKGWPGNKAFALVFSHDVDTEKGHTNAERLMELERSLGFRSSFNFVPEGYPVSPTLRESLSAAGFEVGVHGLTHDGRINLNRRLFDKCAPRINTYLDEWKAVGFVSPSTVRNFGWISELNIEYDSSTFDTDPFEPQSNGLGTIFPIILQNSSNFRSFIELPYTLPQDHCLFIILGEKDIRIWKDKLKWIVAHHGIAYLVTHPDYMNFGNGPCSLEEYPVSYYSSFLDHIKNQYEGQYWNPLPRELAKFWRDTMDNKMRF